MRQRIVKIFETSKLFLLSFVIDSVPPAQQLKTAQALIAAGVDKGYIKSDYKLVGHRQVRETECPGDALFYEIQSWKNYSPFPASVDDLPQVIQLGR